MTCSKCSFYIPKGLSLGHLIEGKANLQRMKQELTRIVQTMSKKSILLTGAAGGIGSAFFRFAANSYTFRLADRDITSLSDTTHQDHEVYHLDIANLDACQQACQDIHTVIHLA